MKEERDTWAAKVPVRAERGGEEMVSDIIIDKLAEAEGRGRGIVCISLGPAEWDSLRAEALSKSRISIHGPRDVRFMGVSLIKRENPGISITTFPM